jgi:hypothetical protein
MSALPPEGFQCKQPLSLGHIFRLNSANRRDNQDYVRWCFANRADAEAFEKAFGDKSKLT